MFTGRIAGLTRTVSSMSYSWPYGMQEYIMEMNDVLLRRANESLTVSMTYYIKNQLDETSFFVNREQDKFWVDK